MSDQGNGPSEQNEGTGQSLQSRQQERRGWSPETPQIAQGPQGPQVPQDLPGLSDLQDRQDRQERQDPRASGAQAANVNHGVQQYGGHSQVGNQAVGHGARAQAGQVAVGAAFTGERSARVEELLTRIEQLLDEHRDELPDGSAPRVELRRLREELAESEPQPGVLRRALDRLTAFAEPVVPLATAVGELARLVQGG